MADEFAVDLDRLDAAYTDALEAADPTGLPVVGYGEISVAFAWPPEDPQVVAKSLPPFDTPARLERYTALIEEYLAVLAERGVQAVRSEVWSVGERAYVLQPLAKPVVSEVLRDADDDTAESVLRAIVDAVGRTVDERVGLDCQVSNWSWVDGELWFLDVTTPMLRDDRGRDRLDVRLFTDILPWAARAPVRRFVAPRLLDPYHDRRATLMDLAGNLYRERLTRHLDTFLAVANPVLDRPMTPAEIRRSYRVTAVTWEAIQRVRRVDRAWQRKVRGRTYPFLMPHRFDR